VEDRSIEPVGYEGKTILFKMTTPFKLLISSSLSGLASLGGFEHIPEDMLLMVTSEETMLA
jgi:hypothetical protein